MKTAGNKLALYVFLTLIVPILYVTITWYLQLRFPVIYMYYLLILDPRILQYATAIRIGLLSLVKLLVLPFIILLPIRLMPIRSIKEREKVQKVLTQVLSKTSKYGLVLLVIIVLLIVSELLLPIFLLSPSRDKVERFLSAATPLMERGLHEEVIHNVTRFVEKAIKYSGGRNSSYELDALLRPGDYYILEALGFSRAHVILFQEWGSCGQYALVVEYLLDRLGFEVRHARFKIRDHAWAEVRLNDSWYIVDSWYIGVLYPAENLAQHPSFKGAKGVIVTYPNGTEVDASIEHGYPS